MTLCTIRVRINRNWSTKAGSATDLVVQIMSAYELGSIVKKLRRLNPKLPQGRHLRTPVSTTPIELSLHLTRF